MAVVVDTLEVMVGLEAVAVVLVNTMDTEAVTVQ
jgi:hypothetical protein